MVTLFIAAINPSAEPLGQTSNMLSVQRRRFDPLFPSG
jgi:hypothetical protein